LTAPIGSEYWSNSRTGNQPSACGNDTDRARARAFIRSPPIQVGSLAGVIIARESLTLSGAKESIPTVVEEGRVTRRHERELREVREPRASIRACLRERASIFHRFQFAGDSG